MPRPKKRRGAETRRGSFQGELQHHGAFGFVLSELPGGKDVFVRGPSLRLAMPGDRVEARVLGERGGRLEGEIVRVLRRARETLVGVLRREGGGWRLAPEDAKLGQPIEVLGFARGLVPAEGVLAEARVTRWPSERQAAGGLVNELLGAAGAPGVRVEGLLRARGVPRRFSEDVLRELAAFPEQLTPEYSHGRRVLKDPPIFTIDGADAKDFDDAVSLERAGAGFRLGVHIADVSAYVRPQTALDREAFSRATSVYLPGQVVPMLPPKLSDRLCSLMPEVDRLAFSCFLELDSSGRPGRAKFEPTVIRSRRRFTYEEVERVLSGETVPGVDGAVRDSVREMGALARRITEHRLGRGALDFDMPEFKLAVGEDGAPTGIERRARLASHRLIEEFMILANEAAARHLIAAGRPFPSRVHEDPDPAKLEKLALDLRPLGLSLHGPIKSGRDLQLVLRKAQTHPLADIIAVMVMRSLKQARYTARPAGHFGLASRAYCHFTSPIRRYPDLLTHRALKDSLSGGSFRPAAGSLEAACAHCSERERAAAEAERDAVDILRVEFLKSRIGTEFAGVVTRVEPYGVFVELPENGAVGLVRGARAALGARVRAVLESIDPGRGEIALGLGADGGPGVRGIARPRLERWRPRAKRPERRAKPSRGGRRRR